MGAITPLEEGNPAEDGRLFRRCLGMFGTGVAIITTRHNGQNAGATVNSVASVSLDPPLVLWSIARTSRSFDIFQEAEGFVINILSKDQMELSRHFASSSTDKFDGLATTPGWNGIPTLDGALAHIECRTETSHDGGDHVIKIGRAVNVRNFEGEPLMFVQGRYAVAADHPSVRVRPEVPRDVSETNASGDGANSLISLIFRVHHLLSEKFDAHRAAEGVYLSVTRIMDALDETPDMTVAALGRKTFLGSRDTEDALAEMQQKNIVIRQENTYRLTEAGSVLRENIRSRWLQFQNEELSGLTASQIAETTEVLRHLWSKP
jgi:flavin reductase (DIM6/NTAB) family NADH-FMN oxidoreductase RutF/DNA-binding MarR family transcriptional regulator